MRWLLLLVLVPHLVWAQIIKPDWNAATVFDGEMLVPMGDDLPAVYSTKLNRSLALPRLKFLSPSRYLVWRLADSSLLAVGYENTRFIHFSAEGKVLKKGSLYDALSSADKEKVPECLGPYQLGGAWEIDGFVYLRTGQCARGGKDHDHNLPIFFKFSLKSMDQVKVIYPPTYALAFMKFRRFSGWVFCSTKVDNRLAFYIRGMARLLFLENDKWVVGPEHDQLIEMANQVFDDRKSLIPYHLFVHQGKLRLGQVINGQGYVTTFTKDGYWLCTSKLPVNERIYTNDPIRDSVYMGPIEAGKVMKPLNARSQSYWEGY